jgi:hypothetical protein
MLVLLKEIPSILLAEAIVSGILEKDIETPTSSEFEAIPGYGIRSIVEGEEVLIGTCKLMALHDISVEPIREQMEKLVSVVLNALRLQRVKLKKHQHEKQTLIM